MSERLPVFVNPEHAATRGYRTSGVLSLEKMGRLCDHLLPPYGEVVVNLEFRKLSNKMSLVGHIKGDMIVQCQRCMNALSLTVDHNFDLGLIKSESEVDSLLPGQEPLIITNEDIRLADVIEDELELQLPMVIKHDAGQCESGTKSAIEDSQNEELIESKSKSPFAALADFKKSSTKE